MNRMPRSTPRLFRPGSPVIPRLALVVAALAFGPAMPATAKPTMEEDVMFSAARAGNISLFLAMVKAGANPTARDAGGNTALILAAQSDQPDMVREALSHSVDIDACGSLGMTALDIAAAHGAARSVERLLKAGADPSKPDRAGRSPLASALRGSHDAIALHLLAAGADPNVVDRDGIGPLHIAAERGSEEMTIALLEHGADPNALDQDKRSPLFVALFTHHREVAEAIVRRHQTDLRLVTQGYPPEFWAQQMGYDDIARSIGARIRRG